MTDTSPDNLDLIGKRVPVLDQGWIELVDFLPHPLTGVSGDLAIVNAARVSFMGESKGPEKDKKLLFYLLRNAHTTPFEMVEFKFRVHAPLVTWWQWVRHRTFCLSGDAQLYFDLPNKLNKGAKTCYKVRLDQLHGRWSNGAIAHFSNMRKPLLSERVEPDYEYSIVELAAVVERSDSHLRNLVREGKLNSTRHDNRIYVMGADWLRYAENSNRTMVSPMKERIKKMYLRSCNEDTGAIEHTHITDIVVSGIKRVFKVTLANGYNLKMSKDHRVLTEKGWFTLEQATQLKISRNGKAVWKSDTPAFAVNGVLAYRDKEWMAARRAEGLDVQQIADIAGVSYHTIRKFIKIHGLQFTSREKSALSGKKQRGQKRALPKRGPLSPEAYELHLKKHGGENSHFWKGGITDERDLIGTWTTQRAGLVHERFNYTCVICNEKANDLEAHHIDPVWHNVEKGYDFDNLVSLCQKCHRRLHNKNLEKHFLQAWQESSGLDEIRQLLNAPDFELKRPDKKKRGHSRLIVRRYSPVKAIEYCGDEITYDVAVEGPFHNFVADGFIVHNSLNAQSGRYTEFEEDAFYIPDVWRMQAKSNKQASEGEVPAEINAMLNEKLIKHYEQSYALYQEALSNGVAREMARLFLPGFSIYYTWVVKADAHNLMHFLRLRMASEAQYEIRVYAQTMYDQFFKPLLPWTAEAFEQYALTDAPVSPSAPKAAE